jgi:hypothetical protein
LPMDGKRVNIYRGIQMLYARYFDNHLSRNWTEEKANWQDFVDNFQQTNPDIQTDLYGNWNNIVEKEREKTEEKQTRPLQVKGAETVPSRE